MDILDNALATGRKFITEYESKRFLSRFGIPVVPEVLVSNLNDAKQAAQEIGYPVVLKGASPILIHKTEYNLVELNIRNYLDLENAYTRIMNNFTASCDQILVQKMIFGERELVVGLTRDFQFGPCAMFGVGGIFAELFRDTSFRLPPLTERDAMEMMDDIRGRNLPRKFSGEVPPRQRELVPYPDWCREDWNRVPVYQGDGHQSVDRSKQRRCNSGRCLNWFR